VALNPDDGFCQANLACSHLIAREFTKAEETLDLSISLGPLGPWAFGLQAIALTSLGRHTQAYEAMSSAIAMLPRHNDIFAGDLGLILYGLERFDEAAEALESVECKAFWHHSQLAACYGQLGAQDTAKMHWARYCGLAPGRNIYHASEAEPFREQADNERWLQGLIKAGLGTGTA
jgi:tetratricopeptide (TPR) repeat protein